MVASEFLAALRKQLNDEGDSPIWSDEELLGYGSEGQREIIYRRPDAGTETGLLVTAPGDLTISEEPVADTVLTLHARWIPALLEYACFRAYGRDDESDGIDLSGAFLKRFELHFAR